MKRTKPGGSLLSKVSKILTTVKESRLSSSNLKHNE